MQVKGPVQEPHSTVHEEAVEKGHTSLGVKPKLGKFVDRLIGGMA